LLREEMEMDERFALRKHEAPVGGKEPRVGGEGLSPSSAGLAHFLPLVLIVSTFIITIVTVAVIAVIFLTLILPKAAAVFLVPTLLPVAVVLERHGIGRLVRTVSTMVGTKHSNTYAWIRKGLIYD
jgi:hypothetical protein